jgi:hypothetical protein
MEQATQLSEKGQCCPAFVQVKRATSGIKRKLEEIGEHLSTKVKVAAMRDGYIDEIDTTQFSSLEFCKYSLSAVRNCVH